jgi:hypothetical protein
MIMVSSPARTRGQNFMHSWAHRFDRQRSRNTTAIRILLEHEKKEYLLKTLYPTSECRRLPYSTERGYY